MITQSLWPSFRSSLRRILSTGCLAAGFALAATAHAETPPLPSTLAGTEAAPSDPKSPCAGADYHALDFWIGDWQVFDGKTDKLVAIDHVRPLYGHCVIQQQLHFTGALYRRPGTPFSVAGMSISRFDGYRWFQMWADNQWGTILMAGTARPDGALQLDTVQPSRGRDVRLIWRRTDTGLRIEQYGAVAGSGAWERYEDLVYRRAAAPRPSSHGRIAR